MRKKSEAMNQNVWKERFFKWRKYLFNKYLLAIIVFAVVFVFVGNQSLITRIRYACEIREKKAELREYEKKIEATRNDIQSLEDPEQLERYAREHYLMHAEGEDLYIIEED